MSFLLCILQTVVVYDEIPVDSSRRWREDVSVAIE